MAHQVLEAYNTNHKQAVTHLSTNWVRHKSNFVDWDQCVTTKPNRQHDGKCVNFVATGTVNICYLI